MNDYFLTIKFKEQGKRELLVPMKLGAVVGVSNPCEDIDSLGIELQGGLISLIDSRRNRPEAIPNSELWCTITQPTGVSTSEETILSIVDPEGAFSRIISSGGEYWCSQCNASIKPAGVEELLRGVNMGALIIFAHQATDLLQNQFTGNLSECLEIFQSERAIVGETLYRRSVGPTQDPILSRKLSSISDAILIVRTTWTFSSHLPDVDALLDSPLHLFTIEGGSNRVSNHGTLYREPRCPVCHSSSLQSYWSGRRKYELLRMPIEELFNLIQGMSHEFPVFLSRLDTLRNWGLGGLSISECVSKLPSNLYTLFRLSVLQIFSLSDVRICVYNCGSMFSVFERDTLFSKFRTLGDLGNALVVVDSAPWSWELFENVYSTSQPEAVQFSRGTKVKDPSLIRVSMDGDIFNIPFPGIVGVGIGGTLSHSIDKLTLFKEALSHLSLARKEGEASEIEIFSGFLSTSDIYSTLGDLTNVSSEIADRFSQTSEARRAGITSKILLSSRKRRGGDISKVDLGGYSFDEILDAPISAARDVFQEDASLFEAMDTLSQFGFGEMCLSFPAKKLYRSEVQRALLLRRLIFRKRPSRRPSIFILTSPFLDLSSHGLKSAGIYLQSLCNHGHLVLFSDTREELGALCDLLISTP